MKNAGIYIRVSTEHQAYEGYSVSAQKNNLVKFARDNDFNIYSIYSDEGISGKNVKDRPEIKRLINDIECGVIEVVLIYKFDRLTRNISDTEDFIRLIQKYDIVIYTLSEGEVDVSTPQGRFVTRLKGAVAQLEREQTSERIKFAFIQKVKDGYSLCSATTCYGYNRNKHQKIMTINDEEAKVVRRIFRMYLDNYTFTEIARILNDENISTKMSGRKLKVRDKVSKKVIGTKVVNSIWQPKMISIILSNSTYIGKVRYGIGTKHYFEVDGLHDAIIDMDIWNKVQDKRAKMRHVSHTKLPYNDVYYCGTLICGICGRKLTTNRTVGHLRKDGIRKMFNGYRCINRENGSCNAIGMSHIKVENAFLNYLENIESFDSDVIARLVIDDSNYLLNEEMLGIKKIIKKSKSKLKQVMDMFLANAIDYEQFSYMTNELNERINYSKKKLEKLKVKYNSVSFINKGDISRDIKEHWEYLTGEEKLFFLNEFVLEIVVINHSKAKIRNDVEIVDVKFYDDN